VRRSIAPRTIIAAATLFLAAGCATSGGGAGGAPTVPTSIQTIEYYPYQVKGYQSTFPRRTVLVLLPNDEREFPASNGSDHAPLDGRPAIGVVMDRDGDVVQRLYSDQLGPAIQKAIAGAAQEAGMTAEVADYADYTPDKAKNIDYVIATIIKRCWVSKRRGADSRDGEVWTTSADFALDVIVFKPPFKIPFWRDALQSTYNDPPVGSFGLGPEDETGIYDEPGEVLSVALTRGIAAIFERQDFRTLVKQDEIRH
jgi:hypothetical protein